MDVEKVPVEPIDLVRKYIEVKPRTILITSYTLGLSYLEKQLLSTLKKKFDTKITIVTSTLALKESFNETVSLNGVGTEYYLFQVNDFPYAFHPKLYFAVDEKDDLTVFAGGANFTYTGMCLNLDAVEVLSGDEIDQLSKNNIVSFLEELEINIKSSDFQRTCKKIKMVLDKTITDQESDALFVHNINEPIFDQIKKFLRNDVSDLRIVSPYFDKDMKAVKKIVKDLNPQSAQILCNKDDQAVNLSMLPDKVKVFIPEFCEDIPSRFVHAKAYMFKTKGEMYTCVGSANCTHAGIMSTSKTGNWETCILRRHKNTDHADGFWYAFFPKEIAKTEFWELVAQEKTVESEAKSLSFNALLTYNILKIVPLSNFPPTPFDLDLTFNLRNGEEETISLQNAVEEIRVEIDAGLKERFGNDPVSVELKIIFPPLHGKAWVMQEHQLRKTNKIRSLEKAIDQLQSDDPQGWNQALDIINFIVENLGYVSARPRTQTTKTGQKDKTHKIPLISGVVSVDDEIHVHGQSFLVNDFVDFGNRMAKLIEMGIARNIDFPEGDDDGDDDIPGEDNTNGGQKIDGRKMPSTTAPSENPIKYHDIIDQIPSFREIFNAAICQPFLIYLKEVDPSNETENMERFEAVLDSISFCLKFTRFLRLELCPLDPIQEESHLKKKYLIETAELLRWFWRTYPEIVKTHNFTNELLRNAFLKTGTLNEMIICLMEFWFTNYEDRLMKKEVFFYAFENFQKLYGNEYLRNSALHYLTNTERFNKERENLLFAQESSQEILLNIEKYHILQQSVGEMLKRQMNYHYWKDAYNYHEQALQRYLTVPFPRTNFAEHQRRLAIASDFIEKCKAEGMEKLGVDLCSRIYDYQKVAGISEIKNELVCTFCPGCNRQMGMDVYQTLKKFEWCECPHCKKLFIPIDKPRKYSFSDSKNDPIWKLELKGIA